MDERKIARELVKIAKSLEAHDRQAYDVPIEAGDLVGYAISASQVLEGILQRHEMAEKRGLSDLMLAPGTLRTLRKLQPKAAQLRKEYERIDWRK
jgi:hypothetical protein